MTNQQQEKTAERFVEALRELASNEERLSNFESYLSECFERWLTTYASTPEGITEELEMFAKVNY